MILKITDLTPELNELAIESKLKGQINLVLLGLDYVNDGGSFTLTTGILMDDPIAQRGFCSHGEWRRQSVRQIRGHRNAKRDSH